MASANRRRPRRSSRRATSSSIPRSCAPTRQGQRRAADAGETRRSRRAGRGRRSQAGTHQRQGRGDQVPAGAGGLHRQDSRRPDRGGRLDPARHARAEHQQAAPGLRSAPVRLQEAQRPDRRPAQALRHRSRGSSATGGRTFTCACASPPSTSAHQLGCASAASQQTRSRPSCLARYSAASARRSRLSGVSLGLSSATPALRSD